MNRPNDDGMIRVYRWWVGPFLIIVPLGIWGLTILYGLWDQDFKYAIIGNWLENQRT